MSGFAENEKKKNHRFKNSKETLVISIIISFFIIIEHLFLIQYNRLFYTTITTKTKAQNINLSNVQIKENSKQGATCLQENSTTLKHFKSSMMKLKCFSLWYIKKRLEPIHVSRSYTFTKSRKFTRSNNNRQKK